MKFKKKPDHDGDGIERFLNMSWQEQQREFARTDALVAKMDAWSRSVHDVMMRNLEPGTKKAMVQKLCQSNPEFGV
jgi:hypothetical protein